MSIFLDTHVVVWLYLDASKIGSNARRLIESSEVMISPIVLLELDLLYEIGRLTVNSQDLIQHLVEGIGLQVAADPFTTVVSAASKIRWTRDPFDRLIVGHAAIGNATLVTKDTVIQSNYAPATW